MELFFRCPVRDEVFASADYRMLENQGVSEDEHGNRVLLGTVVLDGTCPCCGGEHRWRVDEVICPMSHGSQDN